MWPESSLELDTFIIVYLLNAGLTQLLVEKMNYYNMNTFLAMLNIWLVKVYWEHQYCFCDIAYIYIISANSFQYFICLTYNGERVPSIKSMGESRWVVSFWKLFGEEGNNILQARHSSKKAVYTSDLCVCVYVCLGWGGLFSTTSINIKIRSEISQGLQNDAIG